jgi:tetratricopeptide (TPR) repeat protein
MRKQIVGMFGILLFLTLVCVFYGEQSKEETIPVTTRSEKAKKLYEQGQEAASEVDMGKAIELLKRAIQEDPAFFRPLYDLSTFYLYFGNKEEFKKCTEQALKSDLDLSKGEQLMYDALEKLAKNPKADVTDIGKRLVEIYPKDDVAYFNLSFYYNLQEAYENAGTTLKKALEITKNPAPIYNQLGYNYMFQKKFPKAKEAFIKYLELEPDLPNPYDSFGDYYMEVKDYKKAYKSYMKAYELDNTWTGSRDKALKAKKLMEEK